MTTSSADKLETQGAGTSLSLDRAFAVYLLAAQGRGALSDIPLAELEAYAEKALRDICGMGYEDRMLRFLAEQFLIGHYTVLRLHAEGAGCMHPDLRRANHVTATKLSTELRRLSREISERIQQHESKAQKNTAASKQISKRSA